MLDLAKKINLMKVTCTVKGTLEGSQIPKRVFTIALQEEETMYILDSPFHLLTPSVEQINIRFQIFDRGSGDDIVFRMLPTDQSIYYIYSKTGFPNNKDHLEYLVSLGEIPMLMIAGGEEIPTGYVQFTADQ